jgi:rhodanese-related sulfurtransferase
MEFISQNFFLIGAIVAILILIIGEPMRRRMLGIESATTADAVALSNHEDAVFIDVREQRELGDTGMIQGAVHMPLSSFKKNVGQVEKYRNKPVVVYCRSGNRSVSAAGTLKKSGFEKVYNLTGGITAWQKENLPIQK